MNLFNSVCSCFEAKRYAISSFLFIHYLVIFTSIFFQFLFLHIKEGGGALVQMREGLKKAGVDVLEEDLSVQYVPTEELKRCFEFGKVIAGKIKIEKLYGSLQ